MPTRRRVLAAASLLLLLPFTPWTALSDATTPGTPLIPAGYQALVGPLHEHSGYSDGWPGSTPGTYYASAKNLGNDFLMAGEHSDTLDAPLVANDECAGPGVSGCVVADPDPTKALSKWDAMKTYADKASNATFTGIRGFEWSSDRFGHINVYFSRHKTNAKADGGYGEMATFYRWLTARPEVGGGLDGLATFNHPNDKKLQVVGDSDPGRNWNDFAYVPDADRQMVGVEVYNDTDSYGEWYTRVLDQGWHVGAIGAEDLGHRRTDDWGGPSWAKTVLLSRDRTPAALQEAMQARRFYAVRTADTRLGFTVDGAVMGSRLSRATGTVSLAGSATSTGRTGLTLEVVTSGGKVVATGADNLNAAVPVSAGERYYFLRVKDDATVVGYSSPVWVQQSRPAAVGEWLAGDLHVHTCYSHDAYCPVGDSNTDLQDAYTLSGTVEQRFAEAAAKGLDYLAITDHHSDGNPQESGAKSVHDPGFGTSGVVGVPGYENSIRGHAQMLGAEQVYTAGTGDATAINAMADRLREDGGLLQANHPADGIDHEMTSCADTTGQQWSYGYDVQVDTVEVWNTGHYLQPPLPAGLSNDDSAFYWECMLSKGWRVAPTGGSDSHWLSTAAFQGVGNPTTWVFSRERSAAGVLAALKAGRTSISFQPPVTGAAPLLLEGDVDHDGFYEAMVGDAVPPGTPLRVRAPGSLSGGLVQVRANGRTIVDGATLAPGGTVDFALNQKGWVRAELYAEDTRTPRRATCEPVIGGETSYCRNRLNLLAMTAALYVDTVVTPTPTPTPTASPCPPGETPKPRPSGNPNEDKCKKD